MVRQATQDNVRAYESNLINARDIPTVNALVAQTSSALLSTVSWVHMTQSYITQLEWLRTKLSEKRQFLEQERTRLTDESAQLTAQNLQLTASRDQHVIDFDAEVAGLSTICPTFATYSPTRTTLPVMRPIISYSNTAWPDDINYAGHPVPGSGRSRYNTELRDARSIYSTLQTIFRSIKSDEATMASNATKITNNTTSLASITPTMTHIDNRVNDVQSILSQVSSFSGLDGGDCSGTLDGARYEAFDDLLLPGTIGASFQLRDASWARLVARPLTAVWNCYPIQLTLSDGKKLTRLIREADLVIDAAHGIVTFAANAQLYDHTGAVYTPPSGSISFEVYPTVVLPSGTTPSLDVYHTKRLQISRSMNMANQTNVLNNPSFTTELNTYINRVSYPRHIAEIDSKDSQIYKSIRTHLEKHPEYARLNDQQKDNLYRQILNLTTVQALNNAVTPPVVTNQQLFGGVRFWDSITVTDAWDNDNNIMSPHSTLFASYVQGKYADPKPSADDLSSETSYRNWLSGKLSVLIENYFAYQLKSYLDTPLVTQAVNHTITDFVTDYEERTRNAVTHNQLQGAARTIASCKPRNYGSNTINNSWMRLLTGQGAEVAGEIIQADGTKTNYTSAIQMRSGKWVSVTLTLADGKPIILAGATPWDILAKILTWCGGRIDSERERMMLAFSTMKAIIKTAKEQGIHMTVPINGTNGDELRIQMDDNDIISVSRYNYNPTTDTFIKDPNPNFHFDEQSIDDLHLRTPDFLINMNTWTNTILDRQYGQFRDTMHTGSSPISSFKRWMTFDRERMSYKANPRRLRWLLTKWLNRKENAVEEFSFPIQAGNKTGTVTYNPNGTITIDVDGKTRSGKNLAKLLNPRSFRMFWGLFSRKKNITDGLEMQIMQWLYEWLSGQLMDNSRVNAYTYMVRDSETQIVYAMYQDDTGTPQMGIIENVSRYIGNGHTNTRDMIWYTNDIPLLPGQNRWRCKWLPPQWIRQLDETERKAIMSRPEIMDGMMQNMLKSREEMLRIPLGRYRSASLTSMVWWQLAIAAVVGGVDIASGGLLSSAAYKSWQLTGAISLPGATSLWTAAKNVVLGTTAAIRRAWNMPVQFGKGLFGMAA